MRNGRSPRRFVLSASCLVATTLLVAGCQRPLVQQPGPQPVTSAGPMDQYQTAQVPVVPSRDGSGPASFADSIPPPAAVPTPLLDAVAARATSEKKVSLAALTVAEPDQVLPGPGPGTGTEPAPQTDPPVATPAAPPVVEVPASEAPPISGPETKIVLDKTPPKAPEEKAEPPAPGELWRQGLKPLREVARDEAGKNGAGGDWAIRLALLDWMSDDTDHAGGLPWRAVLAPLARAADSSTSDDPALVSELRTAVESLEKLAPLEVRSVELCRKVRGFGCFEPIEPTGCKAGRAVIVYCELAGVSYEPDGDHFRSRVSSQAELRPAAGGTAVWSHELGVANDSCRRRRRDYYVNYRLDLPADLPPGDYELLLTQTDLITHQAASRSTALVVVR